MQNIGKHHQMPFPDHLLCKFRAIAGWLKQINRWDIACGP